MTEQARQWDIWSLPLLALWMVFFLVGLVPEPFFYALRNLGGVVTQNAMVNNPYLITLAFSFYFAAFVYQRCREAGLNDAQTWGRTVQVGMAGMVAFWWDPVALLFRVADFEAYSRLWTYYIRSAVYLVAILKFGLWYYLFGLVLRYCALGNVNVFANMICIFPSATREEADEAHPDREIDPAEWPAAAPEAQKDSVK